MGNKMYNYEKLMAKNPTHYERMTLTNSSGQLIDFYEHPIYGDESDIIAVCHELKLAGDTGFFDGGDFGPDSDYNPIFVEGKIMCEFEAA